MKKITKYIDRTALFAALCIFVFTVFGEFREQPQKSDAEKILFSLMAFVLWYAIIAFVRWLIRRTSSLRNR